MALLIAVAVLILGEVVSRAYFVRKVLKIFETKPPFNVPIYPPQPQAELVSFPSTNGLTLRGSLCQPTEQPSRGLILFFPELDGTHWSAMSYAESLVYAGFALFSFDFRNQGESDAQPDYDPLHWPTNFELEDARAAYRYVQSRDDLRGLPMGVMGISRGSQMALAIAAENPEIRAACCEGAYSTKRLLMYFTLRWAFLYVPDMLMRLIPLWHFQFTLAIMRRVSQWKRKCRYLILERWLRRLSGRPVLFIAGQRDNYVHSEISEGLQKEIGSSAQVWIAPHAKHNRARETNKDEFDRRLVEFFQSHLSPVPVAVSAPVLEQVKTSV